MPQSFRLGLVIRGFLFWNLKFCPRKLGGDPGQGQENLVGVDILQGGGRPSKGGEERSWPGAEQMQAHGRKFEGGASEVRADLSQRNSMILSASFSSGYSSQSLILFLYAAC